MDERRASLKKLLLKVEASRWSDTEVPYWTALQSTGELEFGSLN